MSVVGSPSLEQGTIFPRANTWVSEPTSSSLYTKGDTMKASKRIQCNMAVGVQLGRCKLPAEGTESFTWFEQKRSVVDHFFKNMLLRIMLSQEQFVP